MRKRHPTKLVAVPVVGLVWFSRKNWPALKSILADADTLHDTFDEWRGSVAAVESQMRHEGFIVERVDIDPETFPQWCKSRGLITDHRARSSYAAEVAEERHGQSD